MIIGGLLSAGVIAGLWYLYRLYKRVGRRCPDCGELCVKRESKIRLPSGFYFSTRPIREVISDITHEEIKISVSGLVSYLKNNVFLVNPSKSLKKLKKTFVDDVQWWVIGAEMVTFSTCEECSEFDGHKNTKVVTISYRSISLFHLWWVRIFHREQFYEDAELKQILLKRLKDMYHGKLDECTNPGFKITPKKFGFVLKVEANDDPEI
jgi:hypothetical protein